MMLIMSFVMRTVNPIEDIQGTVRSHEKDVIAGKILHFPVTLQDNQLRQNTNRFQINGKRPQQFNNRKTTVLGGGYANQMRNQRQDGTRRDTKLIMQKGILSLVVRRLDGFLKANGVNNRCRTNNVQNLHDRVVQRVIRRKEIQIPRHKDNQIQFVRADRNTCVKVA